MSVGSLWVLAKTKAQRELWAAENVARQGFDFYLPMTTAPAKPQDKLKPPKPQCLFPRYLFVRTEGPWRFLTGTYGVMGVIMQGQSPAVMPSSEIEKLKAREDTNGLVILPKAPKFRFNNGDSVRINSGAYSGFQGIYECDDAHTRNRVLLEFFGRKTPVLIGEDCLEAAE